MALVMSGGGGGLGLGGRGGGGLGGGGASGQLHARQGPARCTSNCLEQAPWCTPRQHASMAARRGNSCHHGSPRSASAPDGDAAAHSEGAHGVRRGALGVVSPHLHTHHFEAVLTNPLRIEWMHACSSGQCGSGTAVASLARCALGNQRPLPMRLTTPRPSTAVTAVIPASSSTSHSRELAATHLGQQSRPGLSAWRPCQSGPALESSRAMTPAQHDHGCRQVVMRVRLQWHRPGCQQCC